MSFIVSFPTQEGLWWSGRWLSTALLMICHFFLDGSLAILWSSQSSSSSKSQAAQGRLYMFSSFQARRIAALSALIVRCALFAALAFGSIISKPPFFAWDGSFGFPASIFFHLSVSFSERVFASQLLYGRHRYIMFSVNCFFYLKTRFTHGWLTLQ